MKLLLLAMKNITGNWRRSLTLGLFIVVISFVLTFFSSLTLTMQSNMENAVINSLTGHIQLRPAESTEEDMANVMMPAWEDIKPLSRDLGDTAVETLLQMKGITNASPRVRHTVIGLSDTEKKSMMIIGLNPGLPQVENSFVLFEGRFLNSESDHEIVLTEDIANDLRVSVGDVLGILATTYDGYMADEAVTIVGIGKIEQLGTFGLDVGYTDIGVAQSCMGFDKGEYTDIILYANDKHAVAEIALSVQSALETAGIEILNDGIANEEGRFLKMTTWHSQGGFFVGVVSGMVWVFYGLLIFLMLTVAILIANMVFLMGLERFREIGTMRAIGFSRLRVIYLFIAEIITLALLFGGLGITLASIIILILGQTGIVTPIPSMKYVMGDIIYLQYSPEFILPVMGILISFSVIASFIPAQTAASFTPAKSLREE